MSEKDDGILTIAWVLHYHTAHDMDLDDEYVDSFNYMWAWFKSMNLPRVTERVRKELPRARRMNLQLKYSRTIAKWANEVLGRGPRFQAPMTIWLTCPDREYLLDALRYVSQFLGDIDYIYATSNALAITSSTSKHSQRAMNTLDLLQDRQETHAYFGGRPSGRGPFRGSSRGRGTSRGSPKGRGAARAPRRGRQRGSPFRSRGGKARDVGPRTKCMGQPHGKRCSNTLPQGMKDKLT